jgi:hypothetical protein
VTASGISRWILRSCAAAALTAAALVAIAGDTFPIAGTYSQNKPCPTDAVVSKRLRVTITPQEITYASGTCAISDIRRKDNTFTLHTSCQMQAGKVLSSDVMFTLRDDKNLDMVDQFESYKAVLYRCSAQSSAEGGQASPR